METTGQFGVHLEVGSEIACLLGDGRLRNAVMTTVASEAPLWLEAPLGTIPNLECPRNVILVHHAGPRYLRGDGELVSIHKDSDTFRLELSKVAWEDVNRRRYPRVPVKLSVSLRAVHESRGETTVSVVDGLTEDMSVGGSKVWVSQSILEGSLVEFYAHLNDVDSVRALGVVAHVGSDSSVGIAFLDYVGAARTKLEEFVNSLAA